MSPTKIPILFSPLTQAEIMHDTVTVEFEDRWPGCLEDERPPDRWICFINDNGKCFSGTATSKIEALVDAANAHEKSWKKLNLEAGMSVQCQIAEDCELIVYKNENDGKEILFKKGTPVEFLVVDHPTKFDGTNLVEDQSLINVQFNDGSIAFGCSVDWFKENS